MSGISTRYSSANDQKLDASDGDAENKECIASKKKIVVVGNGMVGHNLSTTSYNQTVMSLMLLLSGRAKVSLRQSSADCLLQARKC
ncbi:hypothetical protein O9992_26975 [Vibrio lentus]|nr:hypothetical protein [Vibrio lentus]